MDEESGQAYLLLPVHVSTDLETGEISASLPGTRAFADGATEEEVLHCLAAAATTYIAVFDADWSG